MIHKILTIFPRHTPRNSPYLQQPQHHPRPPAQPPSLPSVRTSQSAPWPRPGPCCRHLLRSAGPPAADPASAGHPPAPQTAQREPSGTHATWTAGRRAARVGSEFCGEGEGEVVRRWENTKTTLVRSRHCSTAGEVYDSHCCSIGNMTGMLHY